MADNQFSVRVPSALEGLMGAQQGYDQVSGMMKQRQVSAAREQAAKEIMQGGDAQSAIMRLMTVDPQGAAIIAGMNNNNRDFQFRQQTHADTLAQQDRQFKLQQQTAERGRVPFGWSMGQDGQPIPLKNGPADIDYVQRMNAAKEKPKEFGYADITKLTEEGGKFSSVNGFLENFKDEYSGRPWGEALNYLVRKAPDALSNETEKAGAAYWQNYDRYKNVVRNDLFGSALTATEQAAFEKADINPSMNATLIRANLAEQKRILQGAMKRKASSLIASKHNPQAIAEAYGVDLKELGVTATPTRGGGSPAQPAAKPRRAQGPNGEIVEEQNGKWVRVQ
jgi:hypothetical protein